MCESGHVAVATVTDVPAPRPPKPARSEKSVVVAGVALATICLLPADSGAHHNNKPMTSVFVVCGPDSSFGSGLTSQLFSGCRSVLTRAMKKNARLVLWLDLVLM